jgi:pSer/pThr/pTyr-binding forkhead associated (FHA) protein
MYKLTVRKGPQEGQSYPLVASTVTVGRDPMSDIVLTDPEVSRQHARFTRGDEGYEVQDLGSTNGTFVDGQRLRGEAVALTPGTLISMGSNVTLVYEVVPDPLATVVSAEEAPEPSEETGVTSELEPAADIYEAPAAGAEMDTEADSATSIEYTPAEVPEPLPIPKVPDIDFAKGVKSYDVPEEEQTVLEREAQAPQRDFDEDEGDALPGFDESDELPSFDEGDDLPTFDEAPARAYAPPPQPGAIDRSPPPPPRPVDVPGSNRNRNIAIAAVIILLLCCCCFLLSGWFWWGDLLLRYLNQFT